MMSGSIGILNVGAGDMKLTFDRSNPAECIRAARIVKDMLRRGYALLIETGRDDDGRPAYSRVRDFDERACEYIIADFDPPCATDDDTEENRGTPVQPQKNEAHAAPSAPVKRRGRLRRVHATSTSGVAVARTAGG